MYKVKRLFTLRSYIFFMVPIKYPGTRKLYNVTHIFSMHQQKAFLLDYVHATFEDSIIYQSIISKSIWPPTVEEYKKV